MDNIENKHEENDISKKPKTKRVRESQPILKKCLLEENSQVIEIGVDEVGRGPLFGRVYTAAVVLPKDDSFDHSKMKDSKKFHSKKKINEVAEYIKENAIAWYVGFEDEKTIDEINILQATQKSMHNSIFNVMKQIEGKYDKSQFQLLIDGNYFNPMMTLKNNKLQAIPHVCIEGGDNKYSCIAAASILAKVTRDEYIEQLCLENPDLIEKYGIDSNKGYGAKKHIEGIQEHGITIWHRRSFGICKGYI